MSDELKKAIEQIKKSSPKLNAVTDKATELVNKVEKLLAEEGAAGASVAVYTETHSPKKCVTTHLEYRRVGGKMCVAIVKTEFVDFVNDRNFQETAMNDKDVTPWLQSPRDERLASFPKLPDLLREIAKETEVSAQNMEAASVQVNNLLSALGEGGD